jgi:hypothetical protein
MNAGSALGMLRVLLGVPDEGLPSSRSWEEVEVDLQVRFPARHEALVESLGWGFIGTGLELYDPRRIELYHDRIDLSLEVTTEAHGRGEAPFPAHPRPGRSLLPIAANGNADTIHLLVDDGAALDSPLWIGNVRNIDWLEVEGPIDALLLDVLLQGSTSHVIVDRFGAFAWRLDPTFWPKPP